MRILLIEIREDVTQALLNSGALDKSDFVVCNYFDMESTAETRHLMDQSRSIEKQARDDYRAAMVKVDKMRERATKMRREKNGN